MAWSRKPGPQRDLPANWDALRAECRRKAGGRCEAILPSGKRCPRTGREAHHYGKPDEHHKLMWLCPRHHAIETTQQQVAARVRKPVIRTQKHPGRFR